MKTQFSRWPADYFLEIIVLVIVGVTLHRLHPKSEIVYQRILAVTDLQQHERVLKVRCIALLYTLQRRGSVSRDARRSGLNDYVRADRGSALISYGIKTRTGSGLCWAVNVMDLIVQGLR